MSITNYFEGGAKMLLLRGGCITRHDPSFYISRPYGQENHVLLLLRSKGEYWINDAHYLLDPGYAIIIAPNTNYHYYNPGGKYTDDWLHFLLEPAESLPAGLKCNTPFILNDFETCSALINQLLWEASYTSELYAASNINALFSVLFNHLSAAFSSQKSIRTVTPYLERLQLLRLKMQNTLAEEHSIKKHAEELFISSSHFQHLYSQTFGISFQNDLIRMRIAYAEILLQTTDSSMDEIAEACGYSNSVHFFRQFKQTRGITPAKYRKAKLCPPSATYQLKSSSPVSRKIDSMKK